MSDYSYASYGLEKLQELRFLTNDPVERKKIQETIDGYFLGDGSKSKRKKKKKIKITNPDDMWYD